VIRTGADHWLIDAGLSTREITTRLKEYQLMPRDLSGIWITHEHWDHIRGLSGLSRQTEAPVYISQRSRGAAEISIPQERLVDIHAGQELSVGAVTVRICAKSHDALDPFFFTFGYKNMAVSVITDLGRADEETIAAVRASDALILEANHDIDMLRRGPYPVFLKRRVAGDHGHLSNQQAADLLARAASPRLRQVLLAHISRQNNTPSSALATVKRGLSPWPGSPPQLCAAPHQGGTRPIRICAESAATKRLFPLP